MRTYNDNVLKPALTQLAKFMRHWSSIQAGKGLLMPMIGGPCVMRTVMMTTVMMKEMGIKMIYCLIRALRRS